MAPTVLSLSRWPMTSADIRTISLYSDARTYFQGPPCSVRPHRVCAVRRRCRDSGREETGGCGKECAYCPLLLHFVFLTTGLQLPEYFNQLSRIVSLMEDAKIKSEAHINALHHGMVSSLTHRGICGTVNWRRIALWLMLDGEPEVGYTPIFLFRFIIISVSWPFFICVFLPRFFCGSSFQLTHNSVFWADIFFCIQPSSWPTIVLSSNFFHRKSLARRTHTRHSKIEYKFKSEVTGSADRDVRV